MSRRIILDDQDPNSGFLFPLSVARHSSDDGPAFHHTCSHPGANGEFSTFSFTGTDVTIFGTVTPQTTSTVLSFSLDGGPSQTFSTPSISAEEPVLYHQALFQTTSLADGSHSLTFTTVSSSAAEVPICIDYAVLDASSAYNTSTGTLLMFQESESVAYSSGQWQEQRSQALAGQTAQIATAVGATATVTFQGSAISLYGSFAERPTGTAATVAFVLDGQPQVKATYLSANSDISHNDQLFLMNDLDPSVGHTLTITTLDNAPIALDYYTVAPVGLIPADANFFNQAVQRAQASLESPSPAGAASSTEPTNSAEDFQPPVGRPMGPVVGGVIGALVAVIIIGTILYRCRTRRKETARLAALSKAMQEPMPMSPVSISNGQMNISPFYLPPLPVTTPQGPRRLPRVPSQIRRSFRESMARLPFRRLPAPPEVPPVPSISGGSGFVSHPVPAALTLEKEQKERELWGEPRVSSWDPGSAVFQRATLLPQYNL